MATARTRATRRYNEKVYARLSITIPKDKKERLEQYVRDRGETINGFTNRLYRAHLGIAEKDWRYKEPR